MMNEYVKGIIKNRYILFSLVNRDLQTKYRRSKLGIAWAIMTPMGLAVIIGSIYSIIFDAEPVVFIPLLVAGLNPWLFISTTLDGSTNAFIGAEGYLKQSTVSPQIFPLRLMITNLINMLYSVLAFFCIYLVLRPQVFGFRMLMFIPGIVIMAVFVLGLGNCVAIITLRLRDYQPMQALILQGLFYVTPILYSGEMLAERGFAMVYRMNPLYYMIEIVRQPLLNIALPTWDVYAVAIALSLGSFFLGMRMVMKNLHTIVFKL